MFLIASITSRIKVWSFNDTQCKLYFVLAFKYSPMNSTILNCHYCNGSFAWCFFFSTRGRTDKTNYPMNSPKHAATVLPGDETAASTRAEMVSTLFASIVFLFSCLSLSVYRLFLVRGGSFRAPLTRTSCCSSNSQVSQWERSAGRLRVHAARGGSAQRWGGGGDGAWVLPMCGG